MRSATELRKIVMNTTGASAEDADRLMILIANAAVDKYIAENPPPEMGEIDVPAVVATTPAVQFHINLNVDPQFPNTTSDAAAIIIGLLQDRGIAPGSPQTVQNVVHAPEIEQVAERAAEMVLGAMSVAAEGRS